jgi:hypothetical protein
MIYKKLVTRYNPLDDVAGISGMCNAARTLRNIFIKNMPIPET